VKSARHRMHAGADLSIVKLFGSLKLHGAASGYLGRNDLVCAQQVVRSRMPLRFDLGQDESRSHAGISHAKGPAALAAGPFLSCPHSVPLSVMAASAMAAGGTISATPVVVVTGIRRHGWARLRAVRLRCAVGHTGSNARPRVIRAIGHYSS
jgi:hypothetical protein